MAFGPSLMASARRSGQRRLYLLGSASGGGGLHSDHLRLTHKLLTALAGKAHKEGDDGRFIELVTASRIIKREIARHD
jgi:hypothetical protein